MNGNQETFHALLERARAGCEQAAAEVLQSYGPHICHVIHEQLGQHVRDQFDSDDLEQQVWLAFVRSLRRGKQFENPQHLQAWLEGVARNKVQQTYRYCREPRRDIDREVRLDQDTGGPELTAPQPSPGDELAEQDWWERWLEKLPSDLREIAIARKEGQTLEEIATARGVSVKTIRRALEKLANHCQQFTPPPPATPISHLDADKCGRERESPHSTFVRIGWPRV